MYKFTKHHLSQLAPGVIALASTIGVKYMNHGDDFIIGEEAQLFKKKSNFNHKLPNRVI